MLITEAIQLVASTKLNPSRKIALLCSYEPLHLKTYVQAYAIRQSPAEAPEVVTFGFDQLETGLAQSASQLKASPALLCLSWEDLHPALSWRTRSSWEEVSAEAMAREAEKLQKRLNAWLQARVGTDTYIVPPPSDWLPLLDSGPPGVIGPLAAQAFSLLAHLLQTLAEQGARILRLPAFELNMRDLLQSGCPVPLEMSEVVAQAFAELHVSAAEPKKVLVTDLDGTLWLGLLGEDGPQSIQCRSEGKGFPFYVFQKFLMKLKKEGVLLAFCSKNNPGDVEPVLDTLGLLLKKSDFASYRCNWEAKSTNLRDIARVLNVLPGSLVMIEDNDSEIAEIRQNLPDVTVFRTPAKGQEWKHLFDELQKLFGRWRISDEDRLRHVSVQNQHRGRESATPPARLDPRTPGNLDYLRDLALKVIINPKALHDARSLELINKTNQFNLHGERISPETWLQWSSQPEVFCLSARLKDRFGDFGTIAVLFGKKNSNRAASIDNFVLSCRAFGRGVEYFLLEQAMQLLALDKVHGRFKDTHKNEPVRQFLTDLGCVLSETTLWELSREQIHRRTQEVADQTRAAVNVKDAQESRG